MKKWEYVVIDVEIGDGQGDCTESELDRWGSRGWKLVSVALLMPASRTQRFYFRRRVRNTSAQVA